MKFNELTATKSKSARRLGRGIGSGRGKTAGRGTKGQGARKSSLRAGFAGGQTPLHMQIPKLRGFKSKRAVVETIYTGQLNELKQPAIDNAVLASAGLVSNQHVSVKLIVNGELTAKKIIQLQGASKSAVDQVQKAGGNFEKVAQVSRPSRKIREAK